MARGGSGPTVVTRGGSESTQIWGIGKSAQYLCAFPPSIYGVGWLLVRAAADPPRIRRVLSSVYRRHKSKRPCARQKSTGGEADFSIFFDFIYVFVIYLLILLLF